MDIKTFIAKDMTAALADMRAELGDNAILLSTRNAKDGYVVLRATVDGAINDPNPSLCNSPSLETFETRYRDGLVARLRSKTNPTHARSTVPTPVDRAALLGILHIERTPEATAHRLAEDAEKSGLSDPVLALASALDARMKIDPIDLAQVGAILVTGPHGAGKTTVAGKLGAHARLVRREVRFVATDTACAGALARLETFAAHLDATVMVAEDQSILKKTIAAAAKDGALLIADSCGFDPRQNQFWGEFLALSEAGPIETIGVLSALIDSEEACEMAHAFRELGAERLVITGLDSTRRRGSLIALALSGLAIAQVSRSPFLAEGLEPITPLGLAREVMARAHCATLVLDEKVA